MPLILILTLPAALAAAAIAKVAVGSPDRREAREERDREHREEERDAAEAAEAERLAAAPPTIAAILERDGLGPAVQWTVSLAQSAGRDATSDAQPLEAHVELLQADYENTAQPIVEAHRSLPRRIATKVLTGIFVVSSVLLFLLVRGVLRTLLERSDLIAVPLALVDVIVTATLGVFLHESIRPGGIVPEWKEKPAAERTPMTVFLLVLLGAFLIVSALLAPARADVLHRSTVAQADQACEEAQAAATPATTVPAAVPTTAVSATTVVAPPATTAPSPATSLASATVACDYAEEQRTVLDRTRLWDQTASVVLPIVEITTAAFALDLLVSRRARRQHQELEAAEVELADVRRGIAEIPDRYIDLLTQEAVRAGYTPEQVEFELRAMGIRDPRPGPEEEPPPAGPGNDPGNNPGPGNDPGNGPGNDPGNNPGPGNGPGTDPGNGPGTDPGNGPGSGPQGGRRNPDEEPLASVI